MAGLDRAESTRSRGRWSPDRGGALAALVALLLGLALGLLVAASGSATLLQVASWIEPIGTLWVNAIRMTVIPLIVASLIVALAGTQARMIGRLGARAFLIFLLLLAVVGTFAVLVAPPLFALLDVDPASASVVRSAATAVERPELPSIGSWVVSLVPTNPIRAAADGAMLPLVVFTIALGIALGRVAPERRQSVTGFFEVVAEAMTTLVRWILAVAPLGVFSLALALALRLGTGVVGAVAFYLAAHSALLVVATVLLYAVAAIGGGVAPSRFARAALPAQTVAVTSRSSMAALPVLLTSAREALRLPRDMTAFVLPLAVSTFRLNQAISWPAMALFAAALYGVELTLPDVAMLTLTGILMSFSIPGIPSGSLFIIAPFFATVGIPPEAVGVLIAVDLVPDVFKTLLNVTSHLTAATLLGRGGGAPAVEPSSS